MKLFEKSNLKTVRHCQTVFGCELPSVLLSKRYVKSLKVCQLKIAIVKEIFFLLSSLYCLVYSMFFSVVASIMLIICE